MKKKNISINLAFLILTAFLFLSLLKYEAKALEDYDLKGASNAFVQALKNGETSVDIGEFNIPEEKFDLFVKYSECNNADVFWFPVSFEYIPFAESRTVSTLRWDKTLDISEINKKTKEFEEYVNEAVNVCFEYGMTDFEKILSAHDYLTERVIYQSKDDLSYTAYSVFVRNSGVCQGYSYAFKHLMDKAGVECHIVSSASLNHAWNVVKLDGEYYHVDLTENDGKFIYNNVEIKHGRMLHEKLLCSDEALGYNLNDVEIWSDISLPKCKSTKYDKAFFKNINGSFENIKGVLYYVEPSEYINGSRRILSVSAKELVLKEELLNDISNHKTFFTAEKALYAISSHGNNIYCAVKDEIYSIDEKGQKNRVLYTVGEILGVYFEENNLKYGVYRKKSYAVCDKIVEKNYDCALGISVTARLESLSINVFIKDYKELDDVALKYSLGDQNGSILIKNIKNGVITIPVEFSKMGENLSLELFDQNSDVRQKSYSVDLAWYFSKIKDGKYDEKAKKVVMSLLSYVAKYPVDNTDVEKNKKNLEIIDYSDEISFLSAEITALDKVTIKFRFSVIGNADFFVNGNFYTEKEGLYQTVIIKDVSVHNFDDVFLVKSNKITLSFNILGISEQCEEETQEKIKGIYNYYVALTEYN